MRWCRGTVAERIFQPWTRAIRNAGGSIRGGRASVSSITPGVLPDDSVDDSDSRRKSRARVRVVSEESSSSSTETTDADIVVMAAGVGATRAILSGSPESSPPRPDSPGFPPYPPRTSSPFVSSSTRRYRCPTRPTCGLGFRFAAATANARSDTRRRRHVLRPVRAPGRIPRRSPGRWWRWTCTTRAPRWDSRMTNSRERRSTTCCEGVSAIACLATSSSRTSPCFDSRAGVTKFAPGTAGAAANDAGGLGTAGYSRRGIGRGRDRDRTARGAQSGEGARVGVRRRRRRREMDRDGDEKKTGVGAPAKIRNVERDEDHVAAASAMVRAADAATRTNSYRHSRSRRSRSPPTF